MGHQIVRQPNGNFAVWSSVVDDFIMWDCTVEELVNGYALDTRQASADSAQKIRDICAKLEAGEKPYFQFTRTFEEMVEFSRLQHGETDDLRSVIELANTPVENRQIDEFAKRGEIVGNWWVMAAWVDSADTRHERTTVDPFPTRADAIAHLNLMKSGRKKPLGEEGEDFFIVPGSGPISPRRYWVELEPSEEDEAVMIREALDLSRWATAQQVLEKIAELKAPLTNAVWKSKTTDKILREAVRPFAAEVPANFGDNPGLSAISDARAEFRLTGLFSQHVTVKFPMAALVRLIRVAQMVKDGES